MGDHTLEDSAWLCARIRHRIQEIAEASGKPELTALSGPIVEAFQDVLDGHGWAITRSRMLREDAPWVRLTWPSNGRELVKRS